MGKSVIIVPVLKINYTTKRHVRQCTTMQDNALQCKTMQNIWIMYNVCHGNNV